MDFGSLLDRGLLASLLRGAARRLRKNKDLLARLDSQGGDGDHGSTMERAALQVERLLDSSSSESTLQELLGDVAWTFMGLDGGAAGPLLGTLFEGMAESTGSFRALDASGLRAALAAGIARMEKITAAREGDKTLMDALYPAARALAIAAAQGAGLAEALERTAAAAEEGARGTAALQARFGRAKCLKERSVGHEDPGAVSVALIFRGFADALPLRDRAGEDQQGERS